MKAVPRIILGLALAAAAAGAARAAEIKRGTLNGIPVITVTGHLEFADERKFLDAALGLPKAVVFLDSPGGNLRAGIEIGRAARLKGFVTLVPKTCASACALAWLGGRERLVAPGARVGFHAAYLVKDGRNEVLSSGNALVGAYLGQLGLSTEAIVHLTEAGPDEMSWLTKADARRFGVEANFGDDLASAKAAVRQAAPPPEPAPVAAMPMGGKEWATFGEWVQVASRERLALALPVAESLNLRTPNTAVFLSDDGRSVVAIGPFSAGYGRGARDALVDAGEVSPDSAVVNGSRFVSLQWGQMPRRAVGSRSE